MLILVINENYKWSNFGVCEVENSINLAWNLDVTNEMARHADNVFTSKTPITFETEVKMSVLRDGLDFHVFYNDQYKITIRTLETLFMNKDKKLVNSRIGFFEFNSDVTFSNYGNTTADEEIVNAKLAALPEEKNVPEWADD